MTLKSLLEELGEEDKAIILDSGLYTEIKVKISELISRSDIYHKELIKEILGDFNK